MYRLTITIHPMRQDFAPINLLVELPDNVGELLAVAKIRSASFGLERSPFMVPTAQGIGNRIPILKGKEIH